MSVRERRGSVLLIMTAALAVVLIGYALPADATSPTPCPLGSSNCVGVVVGTPGGLGSGGGPSTSDGAGNGGGGVLATPANCSEFPAPYMGVCLSGRGGGTLPPCLSLYSQYSAQLDPVALNGFLASNGCPTLPLGAVAAAPPSPAALAQEAAASFVLPVPTTGRYPAGTLQNGQGYALVRANTWFWAGASAWKSYTARASVGGVWAAVAATPARLSFTPGDGHAPVSCAGPGSVWRSGVNGPWDPSPSGCQYQYQHSTINDPNQELTATYTITWALTWTGSGDTSGTLTAKTTTATSTFAVAEEESVVTS